MPGLLIEAGIVSFDTLMTRAHGGDRSVTSVRDSLATFDADGLRRLADAAEEISACSDADLPEVDDVATLPPVPDPQKIICLALNSKVHCAEAGSPEPAAPWFVPRCEQPARPRRLDRASAAHREARLGG